ncbi:Serine protease [Rhodovulum sp. P5]|nr:Serine protease [Rhodovulum sp. P5]
MRAVDGRFALAATVALFAAQQAGAITVRDDMSFGGETGDDAAVALAYSDTAFMSVLQIVGNNGGLCTGTLIASNKVLTADHCARDWTSATVTERDADGNVIKTYTTSAIDTLDPDSAHGDLLNGADIAVLTLSEHSTLDTFDLYLGDVQGAVARAVGYGLHGTGSSGAVYSIDSKRRAMDNVIDWDGYGYYSGDGFWSDTSNILSSDFDEPGDPTSNRLGGGTVNSSATPLDYEGSLAKGDSGGALFVEVDGEWYIVGVASGILVTDPLSVYGATSYWTGTQYSAARTFIESHGGQYTDPSQQPVVPLPAGIWLLLTALAGTGLLRQRAA